MRIHSSKEKIKCEIVCRKIIFDKDLCYSNELKGSMLASQVDFEKKSFSTMTLSSGYQHVEFITVLFPCIVYIY